MMMMMTMTLGGMLTTIGNQLIMRGRLQPRCQLCCDGNHECDGNNHDDGDDDCEGHDDCVGDGDDDDNDDCDQLIHD